MSYEPTLIIVKEQLNDQSGVIEEGCRQPEPKKPSQRWLRRKFAFEVLYGCLPFDPVSICGIGVILIRPELTQRNRDVRELLHELNIEFAVYD